MKWRLYSYCHDNKWRFCETLSIFIVRIDCITFCEIISSCCDVTFLTPPTHNNKSSQIYDPSALCVTSFMDDPLPFANKDFCSNVRPYLLLRPLSSSSVVVLCVQQLLKPKTMTCLYVGINLPVLN